jgi:GNAT superfamily N-acetyltransferase
MTGRALRARGDVSSGGKRQWCRVSLSMGSDCLARVWTGRLTSPTVFVVARSIPSVGTNGLIIRAAEPDDVTTFAQLYLEVAVEVVAREPSFRHIPDADEVEHRYQSRIVEADRAVLVAVNGGTVVGFVDASLQRHEGGGTYRRPGIDVYVEELIVTASQRRRGMATALMQAIETWGRNAQARMIWLDTHLANEGSLALYGAIGYREVGVELM